jgi:osmotically inducible lipoprotein OsmB
MRRFMILAAGALLLAACGETRGQRVVTGAAGGALAGEVIADEPLAGAVIGGGIGAVR